MTLKEHLFTMEIFNQNTLYISFNLAYFVHLNYTIAAIDSFKYIPMPLGAGSGNKSEKQNIEKLPFWERFLYNTYFNAYI